MFSSCRSVILVKEVEMYGCKKKHLEFASQDALRQSMGTRWKDIGGESSEDDVHV